MVERLSILSPILILLPSTTSAITFESRVKTKLAQIGIQKSEK